MEGTNIWQRWFLFLRWLLLICQVNTCTQHTIWVVAEKNQKNSVLSCLVTKLHEETLKGWQIINKNGPFEVNSSGWRHLYTSEEENGHHHYYTFYTVVVNVCLLETRNKKIKTTMWVVENFFLYTILIILMSPQCVHLFLRIISLFSHFQRILYNTLSYLKCRFPLKRITCTNKEDFYPYFNRLNFKDEKRSRKLKIKLNTS